MLAVSPSMTGLAIPVRQPGAAAALKCATPHDVCCWLVSTALQAAPQSVESCASDDSNACVCGHCTPPASPQSDRAPRMRACCIQTRTAQEIVRASRLNARWCAHATPSGCAMQGSPCLRSPASQPDSQPASQGLGGYLNCIQLRGESGGQVGLFYVSCIQ